MLEASNGNVRKSQTTIWQRERQEMATTGKTTNKLTPQQHRAIAALLNSKSVVEAAQQAQVGARTLYRWLDDPTFSAALAKAEGQLVNAATRRLLRHQDDALTTILVIMADRQHPASVRLRAAQTVIDSMLKLRELRDLEERLTRLEEAYAAKRDR